MDNNQKYIDAILKAPLSKHSVRQYVSKMSGLVQISKHDLDWIIDHPKEVRNIIYSHYEMPQTRKAYIATILAVFKHVCDLKTEKKDKYDLYYQFHQEAFTDVNEKYRSGKPSDRQKDAYVSWEDILTKRDELAKTQYGSKHHLIVAMYTYIPPIRQDLYNIKFVPKMPFGAKAAKGNFLVLRTKQPSILVLNEYKTAKTRGHLKIDLPKELNDILLKSISIQPRDYLFVDSQGNPYEKEDSYQKFVNRALQEIFQRPTTVNTFRHSFIIYERKLGLTPGEEEDTAEAMMHSVAQKQNYRFAEKYLN